MNDILKLVVSLSVSASLVGGLLLLLKPLYRDRLQKSWQYYIWLVVVLRLLLPFAPETNLVNQMAGRVQIPRGQPTQAVEQQTTAIPDAADWGEFLEQSEAAAAPVGAVSTEMNGTTGWWQEIRDNLWLAWLGVALLLLVRKVTSYHSFCRFIRAGRVAVDDPDTLNAYDELCLSMGMHRPLPLYVNELAVSPMLVGILRPYIVLPDASLHGEELELILRHENIHHKRGDILYKWLVQIAVSLHWFNPLVYLFRKEIEKNCELSCDAAVLRPLGDERRHTYGNTLISTVKTGGSYGDTVASVTMSEDGKMLKERLEAILMSREKTLVVTICSAALAVLLLCGAAFAGAYTGSRALAGSMTQATIAADSQVTVEEDLGPSESIVLQGEVSLERGRGIEGSRDDETNFANYYTNSNNEFQNTYYEGDYLYALRWRKTDDIELYETAIQVKCGGKNMYLAFTYDTASYATDQVLVELARQAMTKRMQDYTNVQWDRSFFVLTSASGPHSETADELFWNAYRQNSMGHFMTLLQYASQQTLIDVLYRAYEDDRDDCVMFISGVLAGSVTVDDLADRAVAEDNYTMLMWLYSVISDTKRQEIMARVPRWFLSSMGEDDFDLDDMEDKLTEKMENLTDSLTQWMVPLEAEDAYIAGRVDDFKQLMPDLTREQLKKFAQRSFQDMKYEFQVLLMDYMEN